MSLATRTFASIWESPDWALVGSMTGSVGYDSNLTLVRHGPSAILIEASPELTLERHNSGTDFEINGGVKETDFQDSNQPFETDISFGANYSYPKADNSDPTGLVIVPILEVSASWIRSSQPNEFLGARVPNDLTNLKADGYITLSGKLGIRGNAAFQSITYDATSLNDTYSGQAAVGLAYERTTNSQVSINAGAIVGHSIPNDPVFVVSNVRSTELDFTARAQGQVTDKITGSAYGGFGVVRYTGGYTKTNELPVAGADLTWGVDPRRTVVLAAYSGSEYSPNGEAALHSRAFISFTDVIISGWQFDIRTGPDRYEFSREVKLRTDQAWDSSVGFTYQPSDRFRIFISLGYSYQTSTISAFQFDHEYATFGATYHY